MRLRDRAPGPQHWTDDATSAALWGQTAAAATISAAEDDGDDPTASFGCLWQVCCADDSDVGEPLSEFGEGSEMSDREDHIHTPLSPSTRPQHEPATLQSCGGVGQLGGASAQGGPPVETLPQYCTHVLRSSATSSSPLSCPSLSCTPQSTLSIGKLPSPPPRDQMNIPSSLSEDTRQHIFLGQISPVACTTSPARSPPSFSTDDLSLFTEVQVQLQRTEAMQQPTQQQQWQWLQQVPCYNGPTANLQSIPRRPDCKAQRRLRPQPSAKRAKQGFTSSRRRRGQRINSVFAKNASHLAEALPDSAQSSRHDSDGVLVSDMCTSSTDRSLRASSVFDSEGSDDAGDAVAAKQQALLTNVPVSMQLISSHMWRELTIQQKRRAQWHTGARSKSAAPTDAAATGEARSDIVHDEAVDTRRPKLASLPSPPAHSVESVWSASLIPWQNEQASSSDEETLRAYFQPSDLWALAEQSTVSALSSPDSWIDMVNSDDVHVIAEQHCDSHDVELRSVLAGWSPRAAWSDEEETGSNRSASPSPKSISKFAWSQSSILAPSRVEDSAEPFVRPFSPPVFWD